MQVTETRTITRDLHVAPCLKCGHADILLSDSGYSAFNLGGGRCKQCGHDVSASVGCNPTMDDLAAIWNKANDIQQLLDVQLAAIDEAQARVLELEVLAESRGQAVAVGPYTYYRSAPKLAFDGKEDPLYAAAVALIRETGRPSVSMVQRQFRIGYNRASRLVEDMVGTVLSEFSTRAKVLPVEAAPVA